ncbi:GL21482 [Drosophila persimilis]|uniref:GL21482 n=1 Tax=Drosophila persimilis TaxID=7234 RepID=B4GDU9_DROPE|nr:protein unc-45 homolog B [Drosophila persimilis]XP_026850864.1 protein unc-45 homolog B [Drosophila persimilis]EDW34610.1 GL21482 [Drosophila persimilis]
MTNTISNDDASAGSHKDKGNEAFKGSQWDEAVKHYSNAIKLGATHKELPVFYKNRAAAYLKLEKFEKAVDDCTESLKLVPNDPKALFRRAQAYESLEKYEEAYRDATALFKADPGNKTVQPVLQRLHVIVQERVARNAKLSTKVKNMMDLTFDLSSPLEKRRSAANNLVVLAKESTGAELLYKEHCVAKVATLAKVEKDQEIYINMVYVVAALCENSVERTKGVLTELGVPWFMRVLDQKHEECVATAQYCLQTIINALSGLKNKADSKPDKELCSKNNREIDTLLTCLVYSITDRTISGAARDAVIELLTRNIHYAALEWAERLVEIRGLCRLLEVCSELEDYKYESAMEITSSSSTIASVCLARVYENMYYDEAKLRFVEQIDEFIKDKLLSPDMESKVRVIVTITALLSGPLDVGNQIIAREGILQMILAMATTEDELQQRVACECLIAASSKKDKAKALSENGVDILKRLYHSKNDAIRVRALVGLCKLGSYGGGDAAIRPFGDGAALKLAEACRRFLIKPGKDKDIRRWAADGLAYLTLDAECKEKLIEDKASIHALMELTRGGDQSCLYGVVTTFVNLCNAYEKQEMVPEMVELAKFAKQHIPEEHELDDVDFINKRITILANEGITTALCALAKTESHNSQELMARVLNAVCGLQELRGKVVQDGGVKALLRMALEGTEKGKRHACQALARIGITINPEVAFSGQRSLDVIRPLLNLLHQDCTALENFEALMALTNLANMNESVRQRIVKEQGVSRIEFYLMEDHVFLTRAAAQCICNLVMSGDVVKMFEGENDRVKFLALLCEDEDEETAMACAGALAMLTSVSEKCCEKIFAVSSWLDVLHTLIANPSPAVQHRGIVIILNMINSGEETAKKLFQTDIMELLSGLGQLPDESRAKAREVAIQCLAAAERYRIIERSDDAEIPDVFAESAKITEILDE